MYERNIDKKWISIIAHIRKHTMKVILSRKSFDSANGGYPSPILPTGEMISLPIPFKDDPLKYSDLRIGELTYYDLMKGLRPRIKCQRGWVELSETTRCHLDPDIYKDVMER